MHAPLKKSGTEGSKQEHNIMLKDKKEIPDLVNFYKYSSDSNSYLIQSFNGKKIGIMHNDISINRMKRMLNRVMDRLIRPGQPPLERRIKLSDLDSLLKSNFADVGITIPYSFAVIDGKKDIVRMSYKGVNKAKLIKSKLRARLYPNDLFSPARYLSVSFPGRNNMILKELLGLLLLSLIFIKIIVGTFIYSIGTIYRQKRFFTQIVDFINNMTHEFKTPISTISLASEAISNPAVIEDKARLIRYNQVIKDENDRMRQQVEKILQMAMLEKGDYELDLREIDLNYIIKQAAHYLQLQVEASFGKVHCTLNAPFHKILADQVHITNIIHNILDNARKYSPEKPEIMISTENKGGSIFINISDNGIGIMEEHLPRIFDKYYRVPTGNQHDIKGFGLGLSYVDLMVKAHSGKIEIKSKPGRGTTVRIELPVILPNPSYN
jgi:two-component system phosphate regulon sensor histidine kinase PhoR